MKFVQLIKYNNRNIFLKNHTQNEAVTVALDHFLFFKKALYEVKASGLQHIFNTFWKPSTWHTIKTNCIKPSTINPGICSSLIF